MSTCAGAIQGVKGTGKAKTKQWALAKAFLSLLFNGQVMCGAKSCDTGACVFGVTRLEAVDEDDFQQVGDQFEVEITGDGGCFCK